MKAFYILTLLVLGLILGSYVPQNFVAENESDTCQLNMAYVCSGDSLIPIDLLQKTIGSPIYLGCAPKAVTIDYKKQVTYLVLTSLPQILPFNLKSGVMEAPIELTSIVRNMVLSADGNIAYLIHENSTHITQLNLLTKESTLLVTLERQPSQILMDADGTTLYLTTQDSKELTLIEVMQPVPKNILMFEEIPHTIALVNKEKIAAIEQDYHTINLYSIEGEKESSVKIETGLESVPGAPVLQINAEMQSGYVSYLNSKQIISVNFLENKTEETLVLDQPINQIAFLSVPKTIKIEEPEVEVIDVENLLNNSYARASLPILSNEAPAPIAILTIQLTSSPNPSAVGQNVTLKAVLIGFSGNPTGTVTFFDGVNNLGTSSVVTDISGTSASLIVGSFSLGSHNLTATYNGDSTYSPATSQLVTQNVKSLSATSLTSSVNPSTYGQNVTFTANVSGGAIPTGTVSFSDDGNFIGTGNLTGGGATNISLDTLTTSTVGHTIRGDYSGDGTHTSSFGVVLQTVNQATPGMIVSSSGNTTFGQVVTLTATLSRPSPNVLFPTGSVTFNLGATVLGTGTLVNGVASISTTLLPVGVDLINAMYGGDTNYTVNSGSTTVTIAKATPTLLLTLTPNPSVDGQAVMFTATLPTSATGTVTFSSGATVLGVVSLLNGSASLSTSVLPVGTHVITATYSGDGNYNSTMDSMNQVVLQAATTTSLSSSTNPAIINQTIVLTATVNPVSFVGVPTGTVTFFDGSNLIAAVGLSGSGTATLSLSNLNVGTHLLTAQFSGDANYVGSQSSILTQIVKANEVFNPPSNVKGRQVINKLLNKTEYVNVITWDIPSSGTPLAYRIYQEASLTNLLDEIPASQPLVYEARVHKKSKSSTYYIVAVYPSGVSEAVGVFVK